MDRIEYLRKNLDKEMRGIEVAPWCRPIVPKVEGFNSRALDIFSTEELRQNAIERNLSAYLPGLETVDFVGGADRIGEIVRDSGDGELFDYVISSHNFEHIPNPLKFLQGCAEVMKAGGMLTMAIPDKRFTFDYFRPLSTTGAFLEAFFAGRTQPTARQVFEERSLHCRYFRDGNMNYGFMPEEDPSNIRPLRTVDFAIREFEADMANPNPPYRDCHCSQFTPNSLKLIITDLFALDKADFVWVEHQSFGAEFIVHLRNEKGRENVRGFTEEYYIAREGMLVGMVNDLAFNAPSYFRPQ